MGAQIAAPELRLGLYKEITLNPRPRVVQGLLSVGLAFAKFGVNLSFIVYRLSFIVYRLSFIVYRLAFLRLKLSLETSFA